MNYPMRSTLYYRLSIVIVLMGLVSLCLAGCTSILSPTATPVIVYITATPGPMTNTPTLDSAAATALFGPTVDAINLALTLPPLPTATITPRPTIPPTLTPSFTPEFTDTPLPKGTKVVGQTLAAQTCSGLTPNGFTTIFQRDPTVQAALGCPQSAPVTIGSASESFEHGMLLWASALADQPHKVIYALYANGTYQRFDDNWQDGVSPVNTGENAPPNLKVPIRGFGQVWHNNPTVHIGLGWALTDEAGTSGEIQRFARGEMLFVANLNQTYILANGLWRADGTKF